MDSETQTLNENNSGVIAVGREPVVERYVAIETSHTGRIRPFLAGVAVTTLAFAVGIIAFLAISNADDDGQIELDVPAVDVDIDG